MSAFREASLPDDSSALARTDAVDDVLGFDDQQPDALEPTAARARKSWSPEAGEEVAALLRTLANRPWLVGGRDDDAIATVRRNEASLRATLSRLGWGLVVERDMVRLRKSPPSRRAAWVADGPSSLTCTWFFLLVAAASSLPPQVSIGALSMAGRVAAAEAGIATNGEQRERRAIAAAVHMLNDRGVIERLDGDIDGYIRDADAPVLLGVHHTRLAHVVANPGTGDPATDPDGWLQRVERETDPARRMRRRLVDDAVVHMVDLDAGEAAWFSRRLRGDDGGPLAQAFGLSIERRAEGAAFVVPAEAYRYPNELGPAPFPVTPGTVTHAALLLCDAAAANGTASGAARGPGPGWRGLPYVGVLDRLRDWAAAAGSGHGGWAADLAGDPSLLAVKVRELLTGLDLMRVGDAEPWLGTREASDAEDPRSPLTEPTAQGCDLWWFSPATGRWPPPPAPAHRRDPVGRTAPPGSAPRRSREGQTELDLGADPARAGETPPDGTNEQDSSS